MNNKLLENKNLSSKIDNMQKTYEIEIKFLSNIKEENIQNSLEKIYSEFLKGKRKDCEKHIEFLKDNKNLNKKINEIRDKALDKNIKEFLEETKHINIIFIGKIGVGKSTLINALKGEFVAATGGFTPVTEESKFYEAGILRLWDTQGIELSERSNVNSVLKNIKNIVDK